MRTITKEKLREKLSECPGWYNITDEIVDIADAHNFPLRTISFRRRKGLLIVYPRRFTKDLEEVAVELKNIAEKCKNVCWNCACEVNGTCICDECCGVTNES